MIDKHNQEDYNKELEKELKSIKKLAKDKELELLKKAKSGDLEAKKLLCESYLPIIIDIVSPFESNELSYYDLISEATITFLEAFNKYKFEYAHPFKTYITIYIKRVLERKLEKNPDNFGIPFEYRSMIEKVDDIKENFFKQFGIEPSNEKIASQLGISVEEFEKLMNYNKNIIPYDENIDDNDVLDNITNYSEEQDIYKTIEESINSGYLYNAIENLRDLEKEIIVLKFGLNGQRAKDLNEISDILGIGRERVRQIEAKALRKLKHYSKWGKDEYESVVNRTI